MTGPPDQVGVHFQAHGCHRRRRPNRSVTVRQPFASLRPDGRRVQGGRRSFTFTTRLRGPPDNFERAGRWTRLFRWLPAQDGCGHLPLGLLTAAPGTRRTVPSNVHGSDQEKWEVRGLPDYQPSRIRNVALVGHSGAGKTTLAEALLFATGAITRQGRVDDGSTVCDFEPEETKRHLSLSLAMAPCAVGDIKLNIIDTPGYADFFGEVRAAASVADLVVVVVSAVDGVEAQTEAAWALAAELDLPRLVFINKLDRERASFDSTLASVQRALRRRHCPARASGRGGRRTSGALPTCSPTRPSSTTGASRRAVPSPTILPTSSTRSGSSWSRASSSATTH